VKGTDTVNEVRRLFNDALPVAYLFAVECDGMEFKGLGRKVPFSV
jgi:hypothetical protein